MKKVYITDRTMVNLSSELSFREKTEIAKQLDKLGVDTIELPVASNEKADVLLIKNISSVVEKTALSIQTGFSKESAEKAFSYIKDAKKKVLNVALPVAAAQMEYVCALKPDKMLLKIEEMVSFSKTLCDTVEFTALDATRAEKEFLYKAIETAIKAGALRITVCDDAAVNDFDEFGEFIKDIYENVENIESVCVFTDVSDAINMATAEVMSAVKNGCSGIKTAVDTKICADIENVAAFLSVKGEKMGVTCEIKNATLKITCETLKNIIKADRTKQSPYKGFVKSDDSVEITNADEYSDVCAKVEKIGYDLSSDDMSKVYEEVKKLSDRKQKVGTKELEAIIASVAMQVPSMYHLKSYVINSGNVISATANLCIEKDEKELHGVYVGDGPIDAAFLAIEQVVGHHFELDDFQIQSVTEGREAMGQALVKLRSDSGKLYSGSGISTDIIGASIKAYLNALNKIAFEETK